MTEEEIREAMEEGTWLMWQIRYYNQEEGPLYLVKVLEADNCLYRVEVFASQKRHRSRRRWCGASGLRIATPNDMLKYGD